MQHLKELFVTLYTFTANSREFADNTHRKVYGTCTRSTCTKIFNLKYKRNKIKIKFVVFSLVCCV